jgi:hypothetical protein
MASGASPHRCATQDCPIREADGAAVIDASEAEVELIHDDKLLIDKL